MKCLIILTLLLKKFLQISVFKCSQLLWSEYQNLVFWTHVWTLLSFDKQKLGLITKWSKEASILLALQKNSTSSSYLIKIRLYCIKMWAPKVTINYGPHYTSQLRFFNVIWEGTFFTPNHQAKIATTTIGGYKQQPLTNHQFLSCAIVVTRRKWATLVHVH